MRITKKLLINIVILLILIKPMMFEYINSINRIYFVFKIIISFYIFVNYILNKKISKFTLVIIFYHIVLLISTIINKGALIKFIGSAVNTIALVMFTEMIINKDVEMMFKSYISVLDIYLIINTITILFFPNGLVKSEDNISRIVYFLGIDNRFIFFYLPLIFFRFCYSFYKYDKLQKSDILVYMVCLITFIYKWTVGSLIGCVLYIIFIVFIIDNKKLDKIFNLFTYIIGILIGNYLIVIKQVQTYFADFIINVLHKDPTFSSRTLIWERVVYWIKEKPILGNGYELESIITKKIHGANHPHNYILTILYRGGIIYFALFLLMFIMAGIKLKKYSDNNITRMIAFSICVALFMGFADSFDFAMFFVIIEIGYNINKLIKKSGEKYE